MDWILAGFAACTIIFWLGYILGYRKGISRPDPLTATFNNLGLAIQDLSWKVREVIFSGFGLPPHHIFLDYDPNKRRLNEHPADWVERVGAANSGYSIRPGEEWRYWTLRDWWTPDNVPDEFGLYYPRQKDAWS